MDNKKNLLVSCIIPAYNEGPRITNIIKTAKKSSLIDEIIVVNDGSVDNTFEVINKFKDITIINLKKNQGKSKAVAKGIKKSNGRIIVTLDADLINLTKRNIDSLIKPVLEDNADMTISNRNDSIICKAIGFDPLSGERAFKKRLFKTSDIIKLSGFGLETYMNNIVVKKMKKIKIVKWKGVKSPMPTEKYPFIVGLKRAFGMIKDIWHTQSPFKCIKIIYNMKKLIIS